MKRNLILLFCIFMASRVLAITMYLKSGGGAWSAAGTWSATGSGGVDSVGPPAATTDAILEAGSGALTIDAGAVGRSLDGTSGTGNYTGTITHTAAVTLTLGDGTAGANNVALKMPPLVTYNLGNGNTSAVKFASTSATKQTIQTNGRVLGNITIDGVGSYYTLVDSLTMTSGAAGATLTNTNCINFDSSSQAITASALISGVGTKVWTLISSTVTTSLTGTSIDMSVANTTLNSTRTTMNLTGINATLTSAGGKNYYDVNFLGSGAQVFSGGSTFHNLSVTGSTSLTESFSMTAATYTITANLTFIGNSTINRLLVAGSFGTNTTFLAPGSQINITNCDFRDIVATRLTPWTGTSVGDALRNFNITFDPSVNRFAVNADGRVWSDPGMWSNASGGATGFSVPLPQDEVFINGNSGSGTISSDMPRMGMDIDFTGYAGTWASTNTANSLYGSLTLAPAMTLSASVTLSVLGNRNTLTINSKGKTIPASQFIVAAPSGVYTLQDPLTLSGNNGFVLQGGTFASNGHSVTSTIFSFISGALDKTCQPSTSTFSTTSQSAVTIWTTLSASLVWYGGSEFITVTGATANQRTFAGGGKTFGTLNYIITGSAGTLVISGANSFDTINYTNNNTRTLTLPASTITTIRNIFNVRGSAAGRITINSSTGGTQATLFRPNGQTLVDWVSVQDSAAMGGIWYAGANSSNVGNNSGWIFGNPPSTRIYGGMITINGGQVSIR